MNVPDLINGLFELFGAFAAFLNCKQLIKDKQVKGINWTTYAFYASWSMWNLYYYPSLDQWFSFIGGLMIVVGNVTWLGLLIKYKRLEKRRSQFQKIILPMVRKIIPNRIAAEIVGVQPMNESHASIFTLKPVYTDEKKYDPNDSIFKDFKGSI